MENKNWKYFTIGFWVGGVLGIIIVDLIYRGIL